MNLVPVPEPPAEDDRETVRRTPVQCPGCGRFARWVSDRHYYNGWFSCYRFTVECSRCGLQDVECV